MITVTTVGIVHLIIGLVNFDCVILVSRMMIMVAEMSRNTLVNISIRSDPHVVQAAKQPSCPDHSYRDVHGYTFHANLHFYVMQ